eukprot:TRINITY_DN7335_c0_g2_i1.p1 TRINITY_DN7335_c0_g2~~TRINITY_DN7335_c0_g2_i1.p1  ORF type:complete len:572 (+),score=100.76 TRINITY_DN7335_c0_g2_i1:229-1716(+)
MSEIQLLNKALRHNRQRLHRAQGTVMQMFVTRCLATGCAWLFQAFMYQIILYTSYRAVPGDSGGSPQRTLLCYVIYFGFLVIFVPPCQQVLAKSELVKGFIADKKEEGETATKWCSSCRVRLASLLQLQMKALPLTLAWGFKDVVKYFLNFAEQTLWADILVSASLVLVVTGLLSLRECLKAERGSLRARYTALPNSMMLGVGFAINQVSRFGIDKLTDYIGDKITFGALAILGVIIQMVYWAILYIFVKTLNDWHANWQARRQDPGGLDAIKEQEAQLPKTCWDEDDFEDEIEEVADDMLETLTRASAFVYGWGLSDTLQAIYYPFFMGVSGYTAASYQEVWYFAFLVTLILGLFVRRLSTLQYRSAQSKAYRDLMVIAMSLTVGWSWMNVFEVTTNYFIAQWNAAHPEDCAVTAIICYLCLLVFSLGLMSEIYFGIMDEVRVLQRSQDEFNKAYKTDDTYIDVETQPAFTFTLKDTYSTSADLSSANLSVVSV